MDWVQPVVVAVTGHRNSGKTTAIERIIAILGRDFRVATIKHCHHGADFDRPGKDSWRHRKAGSFATAIVGAGETVVMRQAVEDDPVATARWAFPEADIVLAEGFHWLPLPRVEIESSDGNTRPAHPDGVTISRLPHMFVDDDVRAVARQVGDLLLDRPAHRVRGPEPALHS